MAGNLKSNRNFVRVVAASIGVISSFGFVSPASAEITTLACEMTKTGESGGFTIDVNYPASTIRVEGGYMPAVITEQDIKFNYTYPPSSDPLHTVFSYQGNINRITGLAYWTRRRWNNGVLVQSVDWQMRCRPGTQKF